jgi:hypothetical protein
MSVTKSSVLSLSMDDPRNLSNYLARFGHSCNAYADQCPFNQSVKHRSSYRKNTSEKVQGLYQKSHTPYLQFAVFVAPFNEVPRLRFGIRARIAVLAVKP